MRGASAPQSGGPDHARPCPPVRACCQTGASRYIFPAPYVHWMLVFRRLVATHVLTVKQLAATDYKEQGAMAKLAGEKLLSMLVETRRATPSFEDVPIHSADLEKIIRAGLA